MELKSFGSDPGVTDADRGPVLRKEGKEAHDKEMREYYSNPFKPENIDKNQQKQVR